MRENKDSSKEEEKKEESENKKNRQITRVDYDIFQHGFSPISSPRIQATGTVGSFSFDSLSVATGATSPMRSQAITRLKAAYKKAEEEKRQALRRVLELEETLRLERQEKKHNTHANHFLAMTPNKTLLVAESTFLAGSPIHKGLEGNLKVDGADEGTSALKWARELLMVGENADYNNNDGVEPMTNDSHDGGEPMPKDMQDGEPMKKDSHDGGEHMTKDTHDGGEPMAKDIHDGGEPMTKDTQTRRKRPVALYPKQILNNFDGNTNDDGSFNDSAPLPASSMRNLISYFQEAVKCIPFEYTSPSTGNSFVIRRPYGTETAPALFGSASETCHEQYSCHAHVSEPATVEVAVTIAADNSVLLLFGEEGVRHRRDLNGEFTLVTRAALGAVSYVDSDGRKHGYSMDDVLEEALEVRDRYCFTVTSAALGFENRSKHERNARLESPIKEPCNGHDQVATSLPSQVYTTSVGVDTSDLTYPPASCPNKETYRDGHRDSASLQQVQTSLLGVDTSDISISPATLESTHCTDETTWVDFDASLKPTATTQCQCQSEKTIDYSSKHASSGELLLTLFGLVFKITFRLIWWILVTLPLTVIRTSLIMAFSLAVLGIAYLYASENSMNGGQFANSDGSSGALFATSNAPVPQYHSNHVPGIL